MLTLSHQDLTLQESNCTAPGILIVEDEALVAMDLELRLKHLGFRVTATAQNSREALRAAAEAPPDLVLMDINLGAGDDGVATAQALRSEREVPVIYLTANSDPATVNRAAQSGPLGYLLKPFDDRRLEIAIQMGLATHGMRQSLRKTEQRFVAELKDAHDDLLRKHEELQTFYHTVSHEVKTPLTSAREFVSLVLEELAGPITETQREYLSIAHESCDQMRTCINDMLDVTRLETGKMSVELKLRPLEPVLRRITTRLLPAAGRKGIELTCIAAPALPDILMDETRIAQVITNLLNNALKFTAPGGRIIVSVDSGEGGFFHITVADTGRGIPPEHLSRIFDRLYQVRAEDASSCAGLGLGLHICKELVELHGGKIRVESEAGRGTSFHIALPVQHSGRMSVLLVDDQPDLSEALKCLLEEEGFVVTVAHDGSNALACIEKKLPDVLITDLAMPGMKGPELLEQLRTRWGNDVRVIVYTGYPDGELMSRALQYSPFTLLNKGGDMAQFIRAIREVTQGLAGSSSS